MAQTTSKRVITTNDTNEQVATGSRKMEEAVIMDQNEEEEEETESNTSSNRIIQEIDNSGGKIHNDNEVGIITSSKVPKETMHPKLITKKAKSTSLSSTTTARANYNQSSSRLFQPYRTLGIITSGKGFYVQSAGTENFLIVPIGDRFQVLRCDKLAPCLVSATVPSPFISKVRTKSRRSKKESTTTTNRKINFSSEVDGLLLANNHNKGQQKQISHVIPDMSIGIALVSHGNCVSLFKRMIHPMATMELSSAFPIQQMVYMGRTKQDISSCTSTNYESTAVEGVDFNNEDLILNVDIQKRTAMLVAVICSSSRYSTTNNDDDNVPIVGEDDDDDDTTTTTAHSRDMDNNNESMEEDINSTTRRSNDDISTTSTTSTSVAGNINDSTESSLEGTATTTSSTTNTANDTPFGELILLRVRERIEVIRRIPLPFEVSCAVHPDTYFNKILVGGPLGQLALINVNTGKLIHLFQCILPRAIMKQQINNDSGIIAVSEDDEEDDNDNFASSNITVITQSPAVDTVAVGTEGGKVHLINLKFDTVLFTLEHDFTYNISKKKGNALFPKSSTRADRIGITSLSFRTDGFASAAHIAPLAVGRTDGTISIWDLNTTEENPHRRLLHEIEHFHKGGVAKCTFLPLEPILISSGLHDNCIAMHVFDSPNNTSRVLRHRIGHASPPSFIRYLHPAIGAVIGDSKADGTDATNCSILSGGSTDRTLRLFSTARTVLDREWSQGKGLEKRAKEYGIDKRDLLLPPITMFATSEARSRDFGDTVTIHQNHAHAYVWSSRKGAQSGPVLRQDNWNISAMKKQPPEECQASSVTISACGHFCLVGTKGGMIYKYNIQSGLPRGSYPQSESNEKTRKNLNIPGSLARTIRIMEGKMKLSAPANLDKKDAEEEQQQLAEQARKARSVIARHTATVVGLAVDSLNKTLLSVGSDGVLLVWAFKSHAPHKKSPINLSPSGASKLCHIPESDLAAVALKDFSIVVLDCASLSVVRRLGNISAGLGATRHAGPISDMGFGPDGRRLFTSSFDGTIRVWDVPTGSCVDWLSFQSPPTSLTISPTGEFLVTSHSDSVGLCVWCDKSFFHQVFLDGTPPSKPANMQHPCPISEETGDVEEERRSLEKSSLSEQKADGLLSVTMSNSVAYKKAGKIAPKADGLVTLSGLPPGHWKNLFHLELIKERNKPKEPPKKPPSAPFFLQWREGEKMNNNIEGLEKSLTSDGKDISGEDVWDAVWSDDDEVESNLNKSADGPKDYREEGDKHVEPSNRKRNRSYLRSKLADILLSCKESKLGYEPVTDFFSELGPSAIDIELTELCHGEQDQEGMELLLIASTWLWEACQSRRSFEAVNAYLNRFLYLHANTIAGIETSLSESRGTDINDDLNQEEQDRLVKRKFLRSEILNRVESLRCAQREAADSVRAKMQHALCLLHNFSLIV